MLLTAELLFLS